MKSTFYYSQDIKEEKKQPSNFNAKIFILSTVAIILFSIVGYIQFKGNDFFNINNYFIKPNPITIQRPMRSDKELQALSEIIVKEIEKNKFKKNKLLLQESAKQEKEIAILLNALSNELKN